MPAVLRAAGAVPAAGEEQLLSADAAHGQCGEQRDNQKNRDGCYIHSHHPESKADQPHDQRSSPGDGALTEDNRQRPSAAQLTLDGGDGGDARRVEQAEDQQAGGGQRRHNV